MVAVPEADVTDVGVDINSLPFRCACARTLRKSMHANTWAFDCSLVSMHEWGMQSSRSVVRRHYCDRSDVITADLATPEQERVWQARSLRGLLEEKSWKEEDQLVWFLLATCFLERKYGFRSFYDNLNDRRFQRMKESFSRRGVTFEI